MLPKQQPGLFGAHVLLSLSSSLAADSDAKPLTAFRILQTALISTQVEVQQLHESNKAAEIALTYLAYVATTNNKLIPNSHCRRLRDAVSSNGNLRHVHDRVRLY